MHRKPTLTYRDTELLRCGTGTGLRNPHRRKPAGMSAHPTLILPLPFRVLRKGACSGVRIARPVSAARNDFIRPVSQPQSAPAGAVHFPREAHVAHAPGKESLRQGQSKHFNIHVEKEISTEKTRALFANSKSSFSQDAKKQWKNEHRTSARSHVLFECKRAISSFHIRMPHIPTMTSEVLA
jgi:hypothetical protein